MMDPPKQSPVKPPLITPSASPHPRPSHAYNRFPVATPPLKRQRLVSTPHRVSRDTSSSTSRPQSPADVQKEREASTLRLLDVWSSLAKRYSRRLDEDDIVDVRTGEITHDRGFIRNSRKVDFGAIAAPVTEDATVDEDTDEEEEEGEYDRDELDAFADTTSELDNAEKSEMGSRVRRVPPVTALDPTDAEDLRAFLEAERRRKELFGGDVEEEDYSTPDTQSQGSDVEQGSAANFEDLDPSLLNDAADTSETCPSSRTVLYVDSASEDELDNWDIDESSIVYPVLKREDNDSDIEIIDRPTVLSSNQSMSTGNVRTPSVKPYVLLTPRKSTDHAKSKMELHNFNADEGQESDMFEDSNPRKTVEKGKAKAKADDPFETIITTKATTPDDEKVFATNKVKERRRRNSSEGKAHSEDPFVVVSSQVESLPRKDERQSSSLSHLKLHSVNNRKDGQQEPLREGLRSPRPSDSSSGGITLGHQSSMSRKRKRVSSDSIFAVETSVMSREERVERHFTPFSDGLPYRENQASASYTIPDKKFVKPKSTRRSSSRSQRRRPTPMSSVSGSGSDSRNSSDGEREHSRKPARLRCNDFQSPHHYPYSHPRQSYPPSPHRKQHQHYPPPPEMFPPPMPDPRAQFIITQAMQQLSALVSTPWTPPYDSSSIPCTPSRRHQSRRANSIFNTPSYHPHPYLYSYDPNLSLATLPPESPESTSSPEKSSHGPRKSSMTRGRSRGRRVSFKIDDDESGDGDGARGRVSSPSNIPLRREVVREQGRQNSTKQSKGKEKARAETPNTELESNSEDPLDCGYDRDEKTYSRAQTPGPSIGPPKGIKHVQGQKGRLKST